MIKTARHKPIKVAVMAKTSPLDTPALQGLHILVVDDDVLLRMLARAVLEGEGATVTTAADGVEAVSHCLAAPRIDAVLIDREMPVMDGLAATAAIRRHHDAQALPIIGVSSRFSAADCKDARAAGMNECLGKPFDTALVVSTLLRHCRRG